MPRSIVPLLSATSTAEAVRPSPILNPLAVALKLPFTSIFILRISPLRIPKSAASFSGLSFLSVLNVTLESVILLPEPSSIPSKAYSVTLPSAFLTLPPIGVSFAVEEPTDILFVSVMSLSI